MERERETDRQTDRQRDRRTATETQRKREKERGRMREEGGSLNDNQSTCGIGFVKIFANDVNCYLC